MEKRNLDEMTGASNYSTKRLNLDTLSLNGDGEIREVDGKYVAKGGYFRLTLTSQQKKGEKPEEVKLGEEVKVVFLKIRRTLQERNGDKVTRWTNEHNTADDVVELSSDGSIEKVCGVARDLREKYPNLRTIQIVYGLLLVDGKEPQTVKIRIKGASLGSEVKADGVMTFYEYIASFDRKNNEHLRNHVTILKAIKEEGKKVYYAIKFTKGERLSEELQRVADDVLIEVFDVLKEQDEKKKQKISAPTKSNDGVDQPAEDNDPNGGYGDIDEEINAEDIQM